MWVATLSSCLPHDRGQSSVWGVSRPFFEWVTLGSLTVMIVLGLVFWAIGERVRRRGVTGIAVPPERFADAGHPSASQAP